MLRIEGLAAGYGGGLVLMGIDLTLEPREILGVTGRNGMGKTTLLRAVMGLVSCESGSVSLDGNPLVGRGTADIARCGLAYVPQGRELFGDLSVRENIRLAQLGCPGSGQPSFDELVELFPILKEKAGSLAASLSGGQQQQVALARALAAAPRYLLLDEPSEGIQPSLVLKLGRTLRDFVSRYGIGVLLVEQNLTLLRQIAGRCLVLEKGRVVGDYGREDMLHEGRLESHLAL